MYNINFFLNVSYQNHSPRLSAEKKNGSKNEFSL